MNGFPDTSAVNFRLGGHLLLNIATARASADVEIEDSLVDGSGMLSALGKNSCRWQHDDGGGQGQIGDEFSGLWRGEEGLNEGEKGAEKLCGGVRFSS